MVTVEEEYFLRLSLLILKGCRDIALKVLRRVELEEIKTSGKTIDVILRDKEQKLKHKFSSNKQREKLFPENGPTHPETWDLAMIASVLLSCFRKSLDENEIEAIKSMSYKRNGVHAHSYSASLPRNTYEEVCKQLKQDISVLSSKFDQAVSTNCNNIISDCLTGKLDITTEKDAVKLVADSDDLFQKILSDIEKIEERIQKIEPDLQQIVRRKLTEVLGEGRSIRILEVIDSELEVSGKDVDEHNVVLVERIITTVTKEAIDRVGSDAAVNRIREAIDEILIEIQRTGVTVIGVERKCILIKLSCPSAIELLNLLNLLLTNEFHYLLDKLADALQYHLDLWNPLFLTFRISEESLKSIHEVLGRGEKMGFKIQCESVEGLSNLWNYFEEGGATKGFSKLSKALSEYVGLEVNVRGRLNYARVGEIIQASSDIKQDGADLTTSQNSLTEASQLMVLEKLTSWEIYTP